jgi:16S rRNA (adenine1518-N6/adenine1519-N6)-dimethyltransferase
MELLDIVDEHDQVVGTAPYSDAYSKQLPHRIVHVLIRNDSGAMVLQKRSQQKSFCPGHWSTAVGGHVQAGESYEQAAQRETREELGVELPLNFLGKQKYEVNGLVKFLGVFEAIFNGPFDINPEEVELVQFFPRAELQAMLAANEPFHPELLLLLQTD